MKNPLYGDQEQWDSLPLDQKLEWMREHLCTGPCGQSSQTMAQRSRMNAALQEAVVAADTKLAFDERIEEWKELSRCLDKLLACYRVGNPPGHLLDRIRKLKERLGEI